MPEPTADLASMTDEQLVAAYRAGQVEAFEALVERYRREMFHFLLRFVSSRAAADDVFQETFLQIHNSIDTFDPSRRLKPWLFTIGANKARDYLRRNKRRKAMPLSATVDDQGEGPAFVDLMEADLPLPDDRVEAAELAGRVREAVDQLPDHLREVLLLAYFKQLPYKEIAEALGIPLGTVKSRLHAAVGTFAQLWKARYAEAEDREQTDDDPEA
jgi:RNA polymerase sigma-70 factor (ECF subfamily)